MSEEWIPIEPIYEGPGPEIVTFPVDYQIAQAFGMTLEEIGEMAMEEYRAMVEIYRTMEMCPKRR
jgi:hypothetical protein